MRPGEDMFPDKHAAVVALLLLLITANDVLGIAAKTELLVHHHSGTQLQSSGLGSSLTS